MTTERKKMEYELAAYEAAAFDGNLRYPFAWAILFLLDNYKTLDARLYEPSDLREEREELAKIVDWIKNGDPETRDEEDYSEQTEGHPGHPHEYGDS
jgi:hypothetical protein